MNKKGTVMNKLFLINLCIWGLFINWVVVFYLSDIVLGAKLFFNFKYRNASEQPGQSLFTVRVSNWNGGFSCDIDNFTGFSENKHFSSSRNLLFWQYFWENLHSNFPFSPLQQLLLKPPNFPGFGAGGSPRPPASHLLTSRPFTWLPESIRKVKTNPWSRFGWNFQKINLTCQDLAISGFGAKRQKKIGFLGSHNTIF